MQHFLQPVTSLQDLYITNFVTKLGVQLILHGSQKCS
jgi:hypothetical protein